MDPYMPLDPLLALPESLTYLSSSSAPVTTSSPVAAPASTSLVDPATSQMHPFDAFYADWIVANPPAASAPPSNAPAVGQQHVAAVHAHDAVVGSTSADHHVAADIEAFDSNQLLADLLANPPAATSQEHHSTISATDAEALAKFLAQATTAAAVPPPPTPSSNAASSTPISQARSGAVSVPIPSSTSSKNSGNAATTTHKAGKKETRSTSSAHRAALEISPESLSMPPPPPPASVSASGGTGVGARTAPLHSSHMTPSPSPRDESVPEAALHLLRLALPTGSNGSVATNTSTTATEDASCDEDAEGESEDTSIHPSDHEADGSATTRKRHANGNSAASAGNWNNTVERRTSGRVRKMVIQDTRALFDEDSTDYEDEDDDEDDLDVDMSDDDDESDKKKRRGASGARRGGRRASTASSSLVDGRSSSTATSSKGKAPAPRGSGGGSSSGRAKRQSTGSSTSTSTPSKKPRTSTSSTISSSTTATSTAPRRPRRIAPPVTVPNRTFPADVELDFEHFPRFYRQFPVSTAFPPDSYVHRFPAVTSTVQFMAVPDGAKWNKACDPFNLYAPKFVRGLGDDKAGLCPICVESVQRGGEGVQRWLKLKNSSFVYHMSYAHGLSNLSGLPFSPPKRVRLRSVVAPTKDARDHMMDGLCHKCDKWIPLLSVKNVDAVIPELIWWKHAKPCHGNSTIEGEGDYFCMDDVYNLVVACKNALAPGSATAPPPGTITRISPQATYGLIAAPVHHANNGSSSAMASTSGGPTVYP